MTDRLETGLPERNDARARSWPRGEQVVTPCPQRAARGNVEPNRGSLACLWDDEANREYLRALRPGNRGRKY